MRLEFESTVLRPLTASVVDDHTLSGVSADFQQILRSGIAAAQSGDRVGARRLLFQASGIDPQCEDIWMWLASISEYPEELLVFLSNALDINPENRRAIEWRAATRSLLAKTFVQRAIAAHQEGSADQADQCIAHALTYDRDCEMAWFWKASFEKDADKKLDCLNKVLDINPENEEARSALKLITTARSNSAFQEAKSAAVAGRRKKAFELVDEFLQSEPNNAEAWILRSHLSLSLEQKLESLQRALDIDPANAAAQSSFDFLTATVDSTNQPDASIEKQEVEFAAAPAMDPLVKEDNPLVTEKKKAAAIEDFLLIDITEDPGFKDSPDAYYELSSEVADAPTAEVEVNDRAEPVALSSCSYCSIPNDPQAFSCSSCKATLTLSDIEGLLHNTAVDRESVQNAVTQMEAEWNLRDFSESELTALGIGHFNLGSFTEGFKYIQEASRLNPNNVILAGQLNTLAIRLDEIKRQFENHDAMPKGKTILVVDDSATVRKLISGKLEKSGHHVVCAGDGVEALECLEAGLPDLVLLDIAMPRMDGYEVCKKIRANPAAKDLPVVMISGKDGFFDKVRGRMAGSTGYVTKPFGPETLMKALETYLIPENNLESVDA